ncbi:mechanosensitive ion channel family protein [Sphingobium sp. DC-2]|uniref:mechanosensitive ion channel family protein n=1 Tax=Sphingobium sp. DC-2 TaxID=1303256 RepID=UPI0004C39FB2|nr:mechanosensitive ion channel domain-containing protein [Sphingobium sp. DC-2]
MTPQLPDLLALLPGDPAIAHPLVAAALAALVYLAADALSHIAAPRLGRRFASLREALDGHLRPILRHVLASGLLAICVALWPVGGPAHLVLGGALALAIALLARHILRSLAIPYPAVIPLAVLLFVMVLSGSSGGFAPVGDMLDEIGVDLGARRVTLLGLISMAAICVALFAAVRLTNRVVGRSIAHSKGLDATQKLLAQKLGAIAAVVVAFFVGIDLLGIDLTAFTVFSGALGLAVGFGLQKTFGNLIAGIILLMDRSIKPGDVIVVGESFGWVNKIGVRAVSVITRDGKEHLIPNENLMTQEVENWSYSDRNVRIRIPVGVGFDSDLQLAQQLMLRAAQESPRVLRNPKPNVWLTNFGDNRVEHDILVWISDPESGVGNVKSDVLNRLWLLFRENGVTIPYPQRVLHQAAMGERSD